MLKLVRETNAHQLGTTSPDTAYLLCYSRQGTVFFESDKALQRFKDGQRFQRAIAALEADFGTVTLASRRVGAWLYLQVRIPRASDDAPEEIEIDADI